MASGIKVKDEVKDICQKVTMTKTKQVKYKYAIFKYSKDDKFIECETFVEESSSPEFDFNRVVSALPPKEPRFLLYDFDHLGPEGQKKSDVIMVSWCPTECPIRCKLIQGSSINGLKSTLNLGSIKFVEADCLSDITQDAINERYKWKSA